MIRSAAGSAAVPHHPTNLAAAKEREPALDAQFSTAKFLKSALTNSRRADCLKLRE
jgi:hypothetical protein